MFSSPSFCLFCNLLLSRIILPAFIRTKVYIKLIHVSQNDRNSDINYEHKKIKVLSMISKNNFELRNLHTMFR